ncbi:vomeronasal type-2 receptor 26-like [Leptodactylus fuscus]|uniref:vomeronasal type-2 receptor 26-like n=1 Tax=Leptodactylus fuscus TaxID=238119 RepID=UPI003F4F33BF
MCSLCLTSSVYCVSPVGVQDVSPEGVYCVSPVGVQCVSPEGVYCVSPEGVYCVSPEGVYCVSPVGVYCVSPEGVYCVSPVGVYCVSPEGVYCVPPVGVNCVSPEGVYCVPPVGVNCVSPEGVYCVSPVGVYCVSPVGVYCISPEGVYCVSPEGVYCVPPVGVNCVSPESVYCVSPEGVYCVSPEGVYCVSQYVYKGSHQQVSIEFNGLERIFQDLSTLLYYEKYQTALTVLFAIEEINRNEDLLPNITLGFHLFESFLNEAMTLRAYMEILSGWGFQIPNYRCTSQGDLLAMVGFASSGLSHLVGDTFGMYGYPQISYGATEPLLSNKLMFPYFYRTVPSSVHLHNALNSVLKHFGWTWVGIIYTDVESNEDAIQKLKFSIMRGGGCIEFTEKLLSSTNYMSNEYVQVAKVISDSSATIVIFWADLEFTFKLYRLLYELTKTKKVWIFLTDMDHLLILTINLDISFFNGNLAIQMKKSEIPGLMPFLWNITLDQYGFCNFILYYMMSMCECEVVNGSVLYHTCQNDMAKKMLMGLETLVDSYQVYNAIYALAHALQRLMASKSWKVLHREGAAISYQLPWKLHPYLRRVHFTNTAGEDVYLDGHVHFAPTYDLVNWVTSSEQRLTSVTVGKITSSLSVNTSAIVWAVHHAQKPPRSVCSDSCPPGSRKVILQGKPPCCYDCVACPRGHITNHTDMISCWQCPDDLWPNEKIDKCIKKQVTYLSYAEILGTTLACSAIVLLIASLVTLAIFVHYQNSPVIKATNRYLSFLLLLSLTFTFGSCLLFIGHPGQITCLLRQTIFGMCFTVSVSSMLAKTILVVLAFRATKPGSRLRRFMGKKFPWIIVSFCSSVQAVICTLWLGTCPPTSLFDIHSQPGLIVIECDEHVGFYVMLSYIGCLAMGCLVIAFPARNLPDRYNEAKFITFSMLVFFSAWIPFIPGYLSTKGKYTVAVEVFAILVSAAGVLGCIFLPKFFTIICTPQKISGRKRPGLSSRCGRQRPF